MNVAIFGGTFDPVHRGHLAVARAAQRAFKLGRIYFVPADIPPHKQRQPITDYLHRYAMLTLALRDEETLVPSTMEAPVHSSNTGQGAKPNYSIDTVRRIRKTLAKRDRLFFVVGIDMFQDIGTWHRSEELLREVEFIVVSRPGYKLGSGLRVPAPRKDKISPQETRSATKDNQSKIHWLGDVAENVSSTELRAALASGRASRKLLDEAVVEYIRKEHLYIGPGRTV
jgi:nicotinate-nucleotide adenylyltransferase